MNAEVCITVEVVVLAGHVLVRDTRRRRLRRLIAAVHLCYRCVTRLAHTVKHTPVGLGTVSIL
jgi:hypothetical protein